MQSEAIRYRAGELRPWTEKGHWEGSKPLVYRVFKALLCLLLLAPILVPLAMDLLDPHHGNSTDKIQARPAASEKATDPE